MLLNVRRVDAGQAAALALLWARANARRLDRAEPRPEEAQNEAQLRERLARPGVVAVAGYAGTQLVSCVFASPAMGADGEPLPGVAHVSLLAVAPELWGRGYGAHTLAELLQRVQASGVTSAQLCVLEDNRRARSLYEREGWSLVPVARSAYGGAAGSLREKPRC